MDSIISLLQAGIPPACKAEAAFMLTARRRLRSKEHKLLMDHP